MNITNKQIDKMVSELVLMEMDDNITGSQFKVIDDAIDILCALYEENQNIKKGAQTNANDSL